MEAEDDFAPTGGAVIVRSIERSAADAGLESPAAEPQEKHLVLGAAFANPDFRALVGFARDLISFNHISEVLTRTLELAFMTLPVHRGVILLQQPTGEMVCEISRVRDRVEYRPEVPSTVSRTIIERVTKERVALITGDALRDQRLRGSESVWGRGIRSAMCVPLWSDKRIMGFMQVDSPLWVRSFNERDLDFLTALGNLAAVAVERIQEQHVRARLQRSQSPAVIAQMLHDEGTMRGMLTPRRAEVTVLFADLVGFTAITEDTAPEQVAELLGGFCTRSIEAIFAEGGTLDKFIGDCAMAFFGPPMATSDHAARGIRAAVRIQDAMDQWNRERAPCGLPELKVRIGVNSGPVVLGEIGNEQRADYTVLGNTVNLAARLEQSLAGPGEIVVGDATRRLVGEEFDLEPLGEVALRGFRQEVSAHRVRRARREHEVEVSAAVATAAPGADEP